MSQAGPHLASPNGQERRNHTLYGLAVFVVVLAAVVLRFAALDHYPLPVHQDELSDIYDGYSLAMTGTDRAGARWPFIVRGVGPGDYHPALQVYLTAISTSLCGFSVWAGRLPAAVLGTVAVILIFLFARRLLGRSGGLIALVFATFSPVLIQFGRQAHPGACLPPFFTILIVYLLYRAIDRQQDEPQSRTSLVWLAGAGLAVGLSTSGYAAQRITGLLFALAGAGLILWQVGYQQRRPARSGVMLLVLAVATGMGAFPQIHAMLAQPADFFARGRTVSYDWQAGPRWWAARVLEGYAAHFHPRLLFFSFGQYGELTVARLSVAAFPLLYVGIAVAAYRSIHRRQPGLVLLLCGIMISILPAVVSKSNLAILRVSGVWSLYPILSALGAVSLDRAVRRRRVAHARSNRQRLLIPQMDRGAVLATAALAVVVGGLGIHNIVRYLARPDWHGTVYQNHLVRIGEWVADNGGDYQRVYVDTPGVFVHLYMAAFSGMSPSRFQRAPREGYVTPHGWEKFNRFGRFHFADKVQAESDWAASARNESWLYINADGETAVFLPDGLTAQAGVPAASPRPSMTTPLQASRRRLRPMGMDGTCGMD